MTAKKEAVSKVQAAIDKREAARNPKKATKTEAKKEA